LDVRRLEIGQPAQHAGQPVLPVESVAPVLERLAAPSRELLRDLLPRQLEGRAGALVDDILQHREAYLVPYVPLARDRLPAERLVAADDAVDLLLAQRLPDGEAVEVAGQRGDASLAGGKETVQHGTRARGVRQLHREERVLDPHPIRDRTRDDGIAIALAE